MIRRGIGVQSFVSAGGGTDADAQAFITAAGITDATQQSAINTLVTDLKGYGIWSKMKAIYPMVGGTSSTHKWNLKDPRDLDAAFRLVFSGGGTHASTGWTPNGVNGYGDTFLTPNTSLNSSNASFSYYSRTLTTTNAGVEIGAWNTAYAAGIEFALHRSVSTPRSYALIYTPGTTVNAGSQNSNGHFIANRTSNSLINMFRNGVSIGQNTSTVTLTRPSFKLYLGASNDFASANAYSNKECAFASIGDGLTDTEAANLYTAVQKYQTTLGRSVGTQTVSDADAQAFVNAAVIEDQVQATAINTLVTDLKGYGIWSKMKAIYPFVGGTASAHKWNLKDPRDLDAAFRLVFSGGWTHSSTGALPGGVNGYADTKFNPSTQLSIDDMCFSIYCRTNTTDTGYDFGATTTTTGVNLSFTATLRYASGGQQFTYYGLCHNPTENSVLQTNSAKNFIFNKTSSTNVNLFQNTTKTSSSVTNRSLVNGNCYIGARFLNGSPSGYVSKEYAFLTVGNSLTDTEAANLYTAVQAYQTTLSRNV